MSQQPLDIDPRLGDTIVRYIEAVTGRQICIVLVACEVKDDMIHRPEFVTNLSTKDMENLIISCAGMFATSGPPVVKEQIN